MATYKHTGFCKDIKLVAMSVNSLVFCELSYGVVVFRKRRRARNKLAIKPEGLRVYSCE